MIRTSLIENSIYEAFEIFPDPVHHIFLHFTFLAIVSSTFKGKCHGLSINFANQRTCQKLSKNATSNMAEFLSMKIMHILAYLLDDLDIGHVDLTFSTPTNQYAIDQ